MEKNKATGPDKITIDFFQGCWDIVKNDIIQLFADFHSIKIDIWHLNYGIITLSQKCDASTIQQYRPTPSI